MTSEANNFCNNLMEVNKTNSVVTNQAIYNESGVLLLAEGSDINEKRAEILLQHKLMKPLEQCVGIAGSYDAKQLYELLNKFANTIPGLKVVTNNENYQKTLRLCCLIYEKHPLLRQNLTVLALRSKEVYHRGLFSALAGLAIALELALTPKEIQATFIAGLFHDIGFLYLPPELSKKTTDFTSEQWKAMQAHPLIAQRFFNLIPELTKDIGITISHHHERIDGTGYPHHIFGDKLSISSQIIAATDNILINYERYKHYQEHTHNILLIALKLSDNIYFESVYDAIMILFKMAPAPKSAPKLAISAHELLEQQKQLQAQFENTKFLSQKLMMHSKDPAIRSISAAMGRLAISVVRSGILQPEHEQWLTEIAQEDNNEHALPIIEVSVMHDQIVDQLVHLKNLMTQVVDNIPKNDPQFKTLACDALGKINLTFK